MIRKTILALTATAALATGALMPTTASAWPYHGWYGYRGFGYGLAFGAPFVAATCWQYRYVETRRGLRRVMVNVCGY